VPGNGGDRRLQEPGIGVHSAVVIPSHGLTMQPGLGLQDLAKTMHGAKTNSGGTLRAGVAKSDITTGEEGALIRDPLFAKALVLDDGTTRVAIVTMDTTAIGGRQIGRGCLDDVEKELLPRLRGRVEVELGIPGGHVLVSASHTHPLGAAAMR
jgi:hypothetical protein